MAEQKSVPTSTGGQIGGLAGSVIGGAVGDSGGALVGQQIGQAAGALLEPYLSPEQAAQRREFKKARDRLRTGVGYGFSQAQKQQMQTEGQKAATATLAAQQADLIRQQAGGMISGGAATQANRAMAQGAASAAAQNAANVQAQSNVAAQQQYMLDQGRIDAEAERARQLSRIQGEEIKASTEGLASRNNMEWLKQVAGAGPGGK